MGVYTFSSKPTTPGERTPDLLIRFQAVTRTQPCVQYRFMSVHSRTKLHQVRRYITKYFKNIYDGGFIFLCKTKEILKSDERKLTVFDILPKIPKVTDQEIPRECFRYPDVQYKKVWYNYDGKRYTCMCACVIFLFERSKVSHWPPDVLREELSASSIEGFSHIPTDMVSWSGKLVECRGTPLHIHAALGQKDQLSTAIHQIPDGTTAKCLTDQRGATPLHYAAANGNLESCEIIVTGMGSEMIYHTDYLKRSPLHSALYRRQKQTITYLIQLNSDLDTADYSGNTCLDLLYLQKPKDIEFIISKLEPDCVDKRIRFCLLYLSMKNEKFSQVRQLAHYIDLCTDDHIGTTLLHISAALKLTDVTTVLIDKGFDKRARDITGFLPFHIACKTGATDQIKMLMYSEMNNSDINKGIQLCIRYEYFKGCEEIKTFRSNIELEEITVCMVMKTVQVMLRKFKHKTIDEEPLKHFEEIARYILPIIQSIPDVLNTHVFDCALYGASETLILLKSLGANFNTRDFSQRTPLHEAAQSNKLRCTQVLLKGGANLNATDWRGSTALHYACGTGNLNIVKCLIENEKTKANIRDINGRTPLLVAAYLCRNDIVCYLLKCCDQIIDLTANDKYGYGLLHFAVHLKDSTVDLIIEKLSMKPSARVVDEGSKSKQTICDSSWIGNMVFTDFRAHATENFGAHATDKKAWKKFVMERDESSRLWNNRINAYSITKKIHKSPKRIYEQCSGCGHLLNVSQKHKCSTPSEKRNKKAKLRAFKLHDQDNKESDVISPFFLAVKSGNMSVLKKIRKLDSKASTFRDKFGRNCLDLAIDLRSLKLVKAVVELIPDVEKANSVQRVVQQSRGGRHDSTPLSLLSYLLSVVHGVKDSFTDVIDLAIAKKDLEVIKVLCDNIQTVSDKTVVLAINSGSEDILVPVLKKWKKNKERKLHEFDLLSVGCCSENLSVAVLKILLSLNQKRKEQRSQSTKEDDEYFRTLCKSLKITVVQRHSLLGKLLFKNHPALKKKSRTPADVFSKIGFLLLEYDANLGLEHTGNAHVACECLGDCIEMKCTDLAETLIKKTGDVVWHCELSDKQCSFQKKFRKKMYNYVTGTLKSVSYLQNLLLVATMKDVHDNILSLLLKYGVKYFKSSLGSEATVDVDTLPKENQKFAEDIEDSMTKLTLTVLELIIGEKKRRQFDIFRLWKNAPSVVSFIHLLSRKVNNDAIIKTKEDCFLNNSYKLFYRHAFPTGTTCLHLAASCQDSAILKMVVKAPVSVDCNIENEDGISAIDIAVSCGYWQNYKILMENNGVVSKATLEECCQYGSQNVMKILKLVNPAWRSENQTKSRLRIVQDVWSRLEVGHSIQLLKEVNSLHMLNRCVINKMWEIDEFFLEKASSIIIDKMNDDNLKGKTTSYVPMLCLQSPTNLIVKHLDHIEKNLKSLTPTAIGEILLYITARNEEAVCNHMITQTLTSIEADMYQQILQCKDVWGRTALHFAAKYGNLAVLRYFVDKIKTAIVGKSLVLDILDGSKASPLWYALSNKHWKCAHCLLFAGCDPTCRRAIPDFDTKRKFTMTLSKSNLSKNFMPVDWSDDSTICFGKRVFPLNLAYRQTRGTFSANKYSTSLNFEKNTLVRAYTVLKAERTSDYKTTLLLTKLSSIAKQYGAGLIHVACALSSKEIAAEIMSLNQTCVLAPDKYGLTPDVYALVHGNIETVIQQEIVTSLDRFQALMWIYISFQSQDILVYSFTQLLTYIIWRFAERLEYTPLTAKNDIAKKLNSIYVKRKEELVEFPKGPESYEIGSSFAALAELESDVKRILKQFYEDEVVNGFIKLFDYLPNGHYAQKYNKYSFLVYPDPERKKIYRHTVTDMIKHEIAAIGVQNIPRELLTLVLMLPESWGIKSLMDSFQLTALKGTFLLDLTIIDLIPFFVQSESEFSRYTLKKDKIEQLQRAITMEKSLTLRSDVVDIAKGKQLWSFLELIGQHTLIETGILNPVWQTVMAQAAIMGQVAFIKCIFNSLEVSKMTEEQKSCFIAFICLASLNRRHDIVKYLVLNRIPLVGKMDESPIKDLLGSVYVPTWGILEYTIKGNSLEIVDFLLRCFKDDKNIRNSVNCKRLLQIATETGNVNIFKSICRYMDNVIGRAATREEINEAYSVSVVKGREHFCMQLLEEKHTSLVVYTDDKSSTLHYAAIHGMYSIAEQIVKSRPEIIDQTNNRGHTALDYAYWCGKTAVACLLVQYKANIASMKPEGLLSYGWFNGYMQSKNNENNHDPYYILRPKNGNKRFNLDIISILESGNDVLALEAITRSDYLIKANLKNNFNSTMKLFHSAAKAGCKNSLRHLCTLIKEQEDLITNATQFENKGHSMLTLAIQNCHNECVKILLDLGGANSWRRKMTRENVLHIAVKTEQISVVQLVDEGTNGSLRTETDNQNMTPILYAVSLGLHHILSSLIPEMLQQSATHVNHNNMSEFTCLECLLDHGIGWSKLYMNQVKYGVNKQYRRNIEMNINSNRGFHKVDKRADIFGSKMEPTSNLAHSKVWIKLHEKSQRREHILKILMRQMPPDCKAWKAIMTSMGYENDEIHLKEFLLQLSTFGHDNLHAKLKRAMLQHDYTDTIIRLAAIDTDINDLMLTAAACGNTEFLQKYYKSITFDLDNASINEIAFAFGNTNTAISLQKSSDVPIFKNTYAVFEELRDVLPQRIKWIIGLDKPGDEGWINSVRSCPLKSALSMADLWIVARFPPNVVELICSNVDLNQLIPQTVCDRKYNVDIDSFKKNSVFQHLDDINIRTYLSSSQIYGRQLVMFSNNDNEKLKHVQTVKVICEPPGPGNLPKVQIDQSGNFVESVVLASTNTTTALMVDSSLVQRLEETHTRNQVIEIILPDVLPLIEKIFQRSVKLRIDWSSIESRRRTGNYDLLLKLLLGDISVPPSNRLAGLEDVLRQCEDARKSLIDMYDLTTANIALESLAHIREVVVVYVDNLQRPGTPRKNKSTSLSDILTWEFTYEKNTLRYNRDNFPLLTTLLRYSHLADAVYNQVYRIANIDWKCGKPNVYVKPKTQITLEIDLRSFGMKNGTMVNEKMCQGISREVDAIARECEAMMRLKIKGTRVVLRNSTSVQGTGITIQDSTITITICAYINSQKTLTVEQGQIRQRLEDLEDQQLFGSWDSNQFEEPKQKTDEITLLMKRYGIQVQVVFDEKRILAFAFPRYRRELVHPHTLVINTMNKCIKNISASLLELIKDVYCNVKCEYCIRVQRVNWNMFDHGLDYLNRIYKINDAYAYQKVLDRLKGKISITNDIFICGETLCGFLLKEKLVPGFERTILETRLPVNVILITDKVQTGLQTFFARLRLQPPKIEIDFRSFTTGIQSTGHDQEAFDNIDRLITIFCDQLLTALFCVMGKYNLYVNPESLCHQSAILQHQIRAILGSIQFIKLKHSNDSCSDKQNKKSSGKRMNPEMTVMSNTIEILFNDSPLRDRNVDGQVKSVLLSLLVGKIKNQIVSHISQKLNIPSKQFTASVSHPVNLELDETILWYKGLETKEGGVNLGKFHAIKIKGLNATFLLNGKSSLEFIIAADEKLTIDSKIFKRICKPLLTPSEMQVMESDLHFLIRGENSVRVKIDVPFENTTNYLIPSMYRMGFSNGKSESTIQLSPTLCEISNDNIIALRFTISDEIPTLGKVSFAFNENPIGQPLKYIVTKKQQTSEVTMSLSNLKIKKDGWINITVDHECNLVRDTYSGEFTPCRIVKGNKVIELIKGNSKTTFEATYSPLRIMSTKDERLTDKKHRSPIQITQKSKHVEKFLVLISDSQREITLRGICNQCKQVLKICTPFQEQSAPFNLTINGRDDEEQDNNE